MTTNDARDRDLWECEFRDREDNRITVRSTPWEDRVLKVPTCEIASIVAKDKHVEMRTVLSNFDEGLRARKIGFCSGRLEPSQQKVINGLQSIGFQYIETSLVVSLERCDAYKPPPELARKITMLRATESDLPALQELAGTAFDYGKMYEDPRVSRRLADERQRLWISDLFAQEKEILVQKSRDQIVSFMAFTRSSFNEVDLIIGGSKRGLGLASVWFWTTLLDHFREQGIRRVTTVVSAANIPIVNLYIALGFKVTKTLIGLHKHYELQ